MPPNAKNIEKSGRNFLDILSDMGPPVYISLLFKQKRNCYIHIRTVHFRRIGSSGRPDFGYLLADFVFHVFFCRLRFGDPRRAEPVCGPKLQVRRRGMWLIVIRVPR